MPTHDKDTTRFWISVITAVGLVLAMVASIVLDAWREDTSQLTLLLAGGAISVLSASATWLFRGNGNGETK